MIACRGGGTRHHPRRLTPASAPTVYQKGSFAQRAGQRFLLRFQPETKLALAAQNLTLDKQPAIGKQVAEELRRHTTTVQSQEVQNYVMRLGARITGQLRDLAFSFTFSVVSTGGDNALHEPLAIPGGDIFVPSNLLLTANDEAEFAGMLAQAVARLLC
jgi:predicted Zn-dependent protease